MSKLKEQLPKPLGVYVMLENPIVSYKKGTIQLTPEAEKQAEEEHIMKQADKLARLKVAAVGEDCKYVKVGDEVLVRDEALIPSRLPRIVVNDEKYFLIPEHTIVLVY